MRPRGIFCLSGVGKHDDGVCESYGLDDLDGVPMELSTMRQCLTSLGLREYLPFTSEERRHDVLASGLCAREAPVDAETLVIYCTGHGLFQSQRFRLLLPDGTPFDPASLIVNLEHEKWKALREIVLIIDACSAEPGLDAILQEARKVNTWTSTVGFWGIGASRRLERARQGLFATAFKKIVDRAVQPSWTKRYLNPADIAEKVNEELKGAQSVWITGGHSAGRCRALPNPRYQSSSPPRGLPLPADWVASARGVAAADLPGFFFGGRAALLGELREHLMGADGDPVAVVTGSSGAGRSALLGHLVLTLHQDTRRSMPAEVTSAWPALPLSVAAGRGDPSQVTAMLLRELAGANGGRELADVLRSAPEPLALVLDDLDEATEPEVWSRFFATLRSAPRVRLIVGLPASSRIPVEAASRVHDLDDHLDECVQDVRKYFRLQVELAVPGARGQQLDRAVDALAARTGAEWAVAVTVTALPRLPAGETSVSRYVDQATKALDAAAHRVCRERVGAVLGEKAKGIVSALSALCQYGDAVALPALEWAAAASAPGGPRVGVQDVITAAGLMRSLVECRPAADGSARWHARFGHPEGGGHQKPEEFLQRLPQVADWRTTDWRTVDSGVLTLVSRAAALGLLPGSLLDDPVFLLDAPPVVVSRALQQLRARGDRGPRSHMWSLVPHNASVADRALMLRIGAERFSVLPLVTAFRTSRRAEPGNHRQHSVDVEWVQPDNARTTRVTHMTVTSADPHAAIVTVQDDDSLAFWDPSDGTRLRGQVTVPGNPRDVTVAVVRGRAVALVSTWRREIWLVPCHEDAPPTALPELVPPCGAGGTGSRLVPLLLSLHPSGGVVVASGATAWDGTLGDGEPVRKLATMDTELVAVRTAGPDSAPVVWLTSASGHIRSLRLGGSSGGSVAPFPVPHRPLTVAVSESGNQGLILDASGDLHLRSLGRQSVVLTKARRAETRAAALDDSTAVVGGSTGRSGWLEIHDLTRAAAPARLPLDEPAVEVALHAGNRLLVARTCGLLSMKLVGAM